MFWIGDDELVMVGDKLIGILRNNEAVGMD